MSTQKFKYEKPQYSTIGFNIKKQNEMIKQFIKFSNKKINLKIWNINFSNLNFLNYRFIKCHQPVIFPLLYFLSCLVVVCLKVSGWLPVLYTVHKYNTTLTLQISTLHLLTLHLHTFNLQINVIVDIGNYMTFISLLWLWL